MLSKSWMRLKRPIGIAVWKRRRTSLTMDCALHTAPALRLSSGGGSPPPPSFSSPHSRESQRGQKERRSARSRDQTRVILPKSLQLQRAKLAHFHRAAAVDLQLCRTAPEPASPVFPLS